MLRHMEEKKGQARAASPGDPYGTQQIQMQGLVPGSRQHPLSVQAGG